MPELVSIIIPSRSDNDNIAGLLDDLARQKVDVKTEVIRVTGIAPPARARNNGAKQAKGEMLVFIDCDIRLGGEFYLANLIGLLSSNKAYGAVCASLRLPPDASAFQRRYSRQIAHYEYDIVDEPAEVFVASSACFAMSRELFVSMGGFNENIIRGEDSEFSWRLMKAGYHIMLAPNTWCYHPAPADLEELIRINLRNGSGVAYVDAFYPKLNIDVHPRAVTQFSAPKTPGQRLRRFLLSCLEAVFRMKALLILSKFFYALGYIAGTVRYRVFKRT
ncbi:MAG TPA: hypothetical protein DCL35_05365 [Candidatus Omnitrophica bacterium]|nr:hypothetical protein [Candidatus Omnitrophota bacterium]